MLDGDKLDLAEFEQIPAEGRAAWPRGLRAAAELLHGALALWRGPALSGLTSDALRSEAEHLEEMRLQVLEDRLEADLGRGLARELVAELQPLVAEHPFRERLRAQLMLALYRAGGRSDAFEVYRETRALLADELGLEPSEELRELERRMLARDPELDSLSSELTIPVDPIGVPPLRNPSARGGRRLSFSRTSSIPPPSESSSIRSRCTGSSSGFRASHRRSSGVTAVGSRSSSATQSLGSSG